MGMKVDLLCRVSHWRNNHSGRIQNESFPTRMNRILACWNPVRTPCNAFWRVFVVSSLALFSMPWQSVRNTVYSSPVVMDAGWPMRPGMSIGQNLSLMDWIPYALDIFYPDSR